MPKDDKRTNKQNASLHVYCTELADVLNENGISMQAFVKDIQVDHTMESVKNLWRAIAKAKYGKSKTSELTKQEVDKVYEEINRHVSQFGIHIGFPSSIPPLLEEI